MKKTLILLAAVLPALAQPPFDFKSLDKIGANAKESTNVTLDKDMLKLGAGLLGKDEASLKPLVDNLSGIYIRSYEFDKPGQYDVADLAPLRAYLKSPQWKQIVDVKGADEISEVYLQPLPNNRLGGVAIINAEAMEVNVIYISGVMSLSDLEKLGGNLGIPDMQILHGAGKQGNKSGEPGKDAGAKNQSGKDQKQ